MEPVGLAVGVVGLAAGFTTCMDCFEYVEIGKNFGNDFNICLLRLDVAKLRMTQWAESVGLTPERARQGLNVQLSEEETNLAEGLFGEIRNSFQQAERLSNSYGPKTDGSQRPLTGALEVCNPATDLEPVSKRVHSTVWKLAKRRQLDASLSSKTKWALRDKRRFSSLINNIDVLLTDLLNLVPASKARQEAICKADMEVFDDSESLGALNQAAADDDSILKRAISRRATSVGHSFSNFEADENAEFHFGDKNYGVEGKSHRASHFTLKGNSHGWIGNENHIS